MLIVKCKKNEAYVTGPDSKNVVTVYVVEIHDDIVQLGFNAPPDWSLHSLKVHQAILRQAEEHQRSLESQSKENQNK